jgi:hypothetical protein
MAPRIPVQQLQLLLSKQLGIPGMYMTNACQGSLELQVANTNVPVADLVPHQSQLE